MTRPLLSIKGVETFYGRIQALRGVDMDVNEGEIATLIGSNGAGKSTLMMTVCGVNRARTGSIFYPAASQQRISGNQQLDPS